MVMYKNGELDRVMVEFEKTLNRLPIYVGGAVDRADKVEVMNDGRTSMQYRNSNYYNNGNVNQLFILYLHGYASGKCEGLALAY
jgi:hypothetical protein